MSSAATSSPLPSTREAAGSRLLPEPSASYTLASCSRSLESGIACRAVSLDKPRSAKRLQDPAPESTSDLKRQRLTDEYISSALQTAAVEKQLLNGLHGAELRAAQGNLAAVRSATATVALDPSKPRAMQQAMGTFKKRVNDIDKRQHRDDISLEHAADRATRLKRHLTTIREVGVSKRDRKAAEDTVKVAERKAKREANRTTDRRTYTNRTKLRKAKRQLQQPRGGRRGGSTSTRGSTSTGSTGPPAHVGGGRGSSGRGGSGSGNGRGYSSGRGHGPGPVVPGSRFVRE